VRRLSLPQPNYLVEMVAEHRSCSTRSAALPTTAEAALRHHLRMVLSALPAIRDEHPDYFEDEEERSDDDRDGHAARLYEQMLLIRVFETEAERQYKAARIGGYCHLSSGQEAATVGAMHALGRTTCSSRATAVTASRSRAASRPKP
jgi:hypothetical protein